MSTVLGSACRENQHAEEYEFNQVLFGINSSPFQAQFVSHTHAEKHRDDLPLAAEAVSKSTYMDDSMDSVLDDSQGIELYKQSDELWSKAGMDARKCSIHARFYRRHRSRTEHPKWTSKTIPTNSKETANHVATRGSKSA